MTLLDWDRLADRYRWCVHCGADCWPDPGNQRHDPHCPAVTGLYPVTAEHVAHGARCGCGHRFTASEVYAETGRRPLTDPDGPDADVVVVMACIGCATTEQLTNERSAC